MLIVRNSLEVFAVKDPANTDSDLLLPSVFTRCCLVDVS